MDTSLANFDMIDQACEAILSDTREPEPHARIRPVNPLVSYMVSDDEEETPGLRQVPRSPSPYNPEVEIISSGEKSECEVISTPVGYLWPQCPSL